SIPTIHPDHLVNITNWGRTTCADLVKDNVTFDGLVIVEEADKGRVRSVTFSPDGNIVRSPGIAGTFALLATRPEQSSQTNESIFGSALTVQRVADTNRYSIETEAFVTGI